MCRSHRPIWFILLLLLFFQFSNRLCSYLIIVEGSMYAAYAKTKINKK